MEPSPVRGKLNSLRADAEDAPYAHRLLPKPRRRFIAPLILIAAAGYLVTHFSDLLSSAARQVTTAHNHAPPLATRAVPVAPIYTREALVTAPKPLSECIKPDNIIDEAVATCRYGQFPRAVQNPDAQGMVSASYMAKYRADQQQPARTKRLIGSNVERATVWQWDGKRTYAAQWTITDNRIDGTSVCANYRRGSVEHRECRKGAKVYFREKCREWGKRRDKHGSDASQAIEERFCSAGSSFNPLG